jgi:hypothetical protein
MLISRTRLSGFVPGRNLQTINDHQGQALWSASTAGVCSVSAAFRLLVAAAPVPSAF